MGDDERYLGRHLSKKEVIPCSSEEHEKLFGGITPYTAWRYDIEEATGAAIDYLNSKGIELTTPKVWFDRSSDIETYHNWPPPENTFCNYKYLDEYLRNKCGYQRDDTEELCARIIVNAERLREKKEALDTAVDQGNTISSVLIDKFATFAFRFQEAVILSGVYFLLSESMSKNAQQSRKSQWAEMLADALLRKHDLSQTTDREKIDSLPSSDEAEPDQFVEGYEIYKDGDKICAVKDFDGELDEMKTASFRTGYLTPAKKKKD